MGADSLAGEEHGVSVLASLVQRAKVYVANLVMSASPQCKRATGDPSQCPHLIGTRQDLAPGDSEDMSWIGCQH